MQNSNRTIDQLVALPEEWSLHWLKADSYRIGPIDGPESPVRRDDSARWEWTEGTFWTDERGTKYDTGPHAAEIFDAALHVDPDDTGSLLAFVRDWGTLGAFDDATSSVWGTRRAFRELQRHFAWAQALHRHGLRSAAVPALWEDRDALLGALRALLPPPEQVKLDPPWPDGRWPDLVRKAVLTDLGRARHTYPDPYVAAFLKGHFHAAHARAARPIEREKQHWLAFGWAIGEHLRDVTPALAWAGGRPTAAWELPRLGDLLWVQLWSLATGGAAIRQCRHCRKWFAVDHRGKVFCSRICTNRASAAASYEARKNRNKQRSTRRKRR